jgi:hypothetical protein
MGPRVKPADDDRQFIDLQHPVEQVLEPVLERRMRSMVEGAPASPAVVSLPLAGRDQGWGAKSPCPSD